MSRMCCMWLVQYCCCLLAPCDAVICVVALTVSGSLPLFKQWGALMTKHLSEGCVH